MPEPFAADGPVLVAYASRYGSTRQIAEHIAQRLREGGRRVDLRPIADAGDPAPYAAVVLGSAVYTRRWTPEAEDWARRHRLVLADRPLWLFSVGTFGDRKPLIGPLMRREPKDIAALCRTLAPRGYRVFAGVIARQRWPLRSRLLYHALGGRLGDNRDWPDIDAWASGIAAALLAFMPRREGAPDPAPPRAAPTG